MVPADHDGVDNDGDGEIDEEDEYEVVFKHEDKEFDDLRLDTKGQYVDADGNIVESIVQVKPTDSFAYELKNVMVDEGSDDDAVEETDATDGNSDD